MNTVILSFNDNYAASIDGYVFNRLTGHTIKPIYKNGYAEIRLSRNNRTTNYSLHRLLYKAFKGETNGLHVNHINGIRSDNRLDNLEAITPQENNFKRIFLNRGEKVNTAKLNEKSVLEIRLRKSKGENSNQLAQEYGVSKSAINRIARGETWKHLLVLPVDNKLWGDPRKTGAMAKKSLEEKYGKDYWAKIAVRTKFKKHCETCTCTLDN